MMKRRKLVLLVLAFLLILSPMTTFADAPPKVAAKGAIAMDYETGKVLYEKDINTPRSVASMTKVMTSLLVYDAIADGRIKSDTKIPITPEARSIIPWDPCGVHVPYAKEETVYDLLSIYLIVSSSPAGTALAQYLAGSVPAFVDQMNAKAKELGIDAYYNDPNGLKPNKVTPLAQAKLTRHFIQKYPEVLEITKRRSVIFSGRHYKANNKFYRNFDWYKGNVDGFKSGTMPFAGSCFSATAKRGENRVITVVINSSDMNERYRDSIKLLDYAFTKYPITYKTSEWAKNVPVEAEQMGFNMANIQGKKEFEGTEPITRGEFISMLVKALRLEEKAGEAFIDVNPEAWYAKDVHSARAYGLVQGTGGGRFEPEALLTRQEMALMLQNGLKLEPMGIDKVFKDDGEIGEVFKEAVYRMAEYGIVRGTDEGTFLPKEGANRESATSMILNLVYGIANGKIPGFHGEQEPTSLPEYI
ncbi:MAG: S-layer homology domain-containing protein [Tissierellia bacterium]|nr:S-layer homology domain-containing protein [Tissierellia bacterium]